MRGPVMGLECKDRRTRALRHIIKHNPVHFFSVVTLSCCHSILPKPKPIGQITLV